MTTYELVEAIEKILASLNSAAHLSGLLSSLAKGGERVPSILASIAYPSSNSDDVLVASEVRDILNEALAAIKSVKARTLFGEIDRIEKTLHEAREGNQVPLRDLQHRLQSFLVSYEDFIERYEIRDVPVLILRSTALLYAIETTSALLTMIRDDVERPDLANEPNQAVLSILLESQMEFAEFADKLSSLSSIYTELGQLLAISTKQHPIRMARVESGSLWAKVFGEPRIIGFMISVFERALAYYHRNFTLEGKISLIKPKIQIVDDVLGLKNRLQENGYDTTEMDENIKKSGVFIAKHVNKLLGGEPVVRLNQKVYSVGIEAEKLYIQKARELLDDGSGRKNNES